MRPRSTAIAASAVARVEPLIRDNASFSVGTTTSMPPIASAAGSRTPARHASPPAPVATRATCANAMLPAAPTSPTLGTIGTTSASSIAIRVSTTAGRAPHAPVASTFARAAINARTIIGSSGGPTPAQWSSMNTRAASARSAGASVPDSQVHLVWITSASA